MVCRPENRRGPVARVLVHIRPPGYQRANSLKVTVPGGSDQGRVAGHLSAGGSLPADAGIEDDKRQHSCQ
jgi:hypothetical protein